MSRSPLAAALVCCLAACLPQHAQPVAVGDGPRVSHIGAVAPSILEVVLQVGLARHGVQQPYVAQPGDEVRPDGRGRVLLRGGKPVGNIVGPKADVFTPYDAVVGSGRERPVDRLVDYRLQSPDDAAYATAQAPTRLSRKTKPTDLCRTAGWAFDSPLEHHLFLHLPAPLTVGRHYSLRLGEIGPAASTFTFDPTQLRSEAVHVSQVGFAPSDPLKVAFLSCWLGDGGALKYPAGQTFRVVNAATGSVAASGQVVLAKAADVADEDAYKRNHNGVDVWRMDFAQVQAPGEYRVVVDGIGCSFPFKIAQTAWRDAFALATRGFYHQRSGIALGPPYTEFRRPRCFNPEDGLVVYHSTCGLLDSGNGLGKEAGNFGNLVKGKTDQIVANAWGAYMDAGDWDRRIQHLIASRNLLDLAEQRPGLVDGLNLNLPESTNALPDVIDEALYNLDGYRRMQTPEGGIRGGIESAEHPNQGEASWQETLTVMAYAPDPWSSYSYAGTAALAARVLRGRDARLADVYLQSALRAMRWAEAALPERAGKNDPHQVNDERNLAALELYSATGEAAWHELFRQTTVFADPKNEMESWGKHNQRDAAWSYLHCRQPGVDATLLANSRAALLREADFWLMWGQRSAFGWTKNPWAPMAYGGLTAPPKNIARAWLLTGDAKYHTALLRSVQQQFGANPLNFSYTTGLGQRSPQNPLHLDSRHTGQAPPPGLTVFGPQYLADQTDNFAFKLVAPKAYPALAGWPSLEAYFDVFWWPSMCEYTVQSPMADVAYGLGVLAAPTAAAATAPAP